MRSSLFPRLGQKYASCLTTITRGCGPALHINTNVRHFARLGKRKSDLKPRSPSSKSRPSVALDLCAHIVGPQINQSFAECKDFLLDNPEHVQEFEKDMKRTGMTIVFSDEEVSVIDTIPDFEKKHRRATVDNLERTLHFNESLDFIQTAVNVNAKTKAIHHDQPLNLETANHIIALSLSIVLHFANQPNPLVPGTGTDGSLPSTEHLNAAVKRCAVLGAGGCIFPIILSSVLPRSAQIHAIELSESVTHAALNYFSVSPYVSNLADFPIRILRGEAADPGAVLQPHTDNQFELHTGCGIQWLSQEVAANTSTKKKGKFDMVFVDIFDGDIDNTDGDSDTSNTERTMRITDELISNATLDALADGGGNDEGGDGMTPDTDTSSSDTPFTPEGSELFIPSRNIINRDNIRMFAEALSDNGGLLAINTVGNLAAIEGAARWMERLLNGPASCAEVEGAPEGQEEEEEGEGGGQPAGGTARPPSRPHYHVGFMKVPIVLEEEENCDRGGQEEKRGGGGSQGARNDPFVRRDNIVLFIVKNPTIPKLTSGVLKDNFRKYMSLSDEQSRPQSSIPLPFSNEKLEPFVSKWISMYEDVSDS